MADGMNVTDTLVFELKINDGGAGKSTPEMKKEVDALAGSIIGLQQSNKKLREERNKVDTSTELGIAKIKELNAQLDKNNEIIKQNSSNLEKQRMNVGNYKKGITDALKEIRIGGVSVGEVMDKLDKANEDLFKGMIAGFKESGLQAKLFGTTARTALTLTGIGLIIAGLATIIVYWEDIKKAIGLADDKQQSFFKTQQEAIDASRAKLAQYNTELEVQNRILQVIGDKEKEISANRRAAAVSQLNTQLKEQENLRLQINLMLKALEIEKGRKDLSSVTEQEFKEIGRVLKENGGTAEENVLRLKKAYDEATKAVVNSKNNIQLLSVEQAKQEEELREKAHLAFLTRLHEEERLRLAQLENMMAAAHAEFLAEQDIENKKAKMATEGIERVAKIREAQRNKDLKERETLTKKIISLQSQELDQAARASGELSNLFKKDTAAQRTSAIASIAFSSAAGVANAVKAGSGVPWPANLAAILSGIAAVLSGITQAKSFLATGGRADKQGTFSGAAHSGGGIDYVRSDGKHRINVEGGENFYVLKKSASREINNLSGLNVKHGGRSWTGGEHPGMRRNYALGGEIAARQTVTGQNTDLVNAVRIGMQGVSVVVTVEDFNAVSAAMNEVQIKAQVV